MTRFLLDINVLIALIDPAHVQHDRAHAWFRAGGKKAWATCPLTENGLLRIGWPSAGTPAAVAELLASLRALPGYEFWPDDISLVDAGRVDSSRLLDSAQVADSYLLALALERGGKLATFDARLVTDAVINGSKALHLIR